VEVPCWLGVLLGIHQPPGTLAVAEGMRKEQFQGRDFRRKKGNWIEEAAVGIQLLVAVLEGNLLLGVEDSLLLVLEGSQLLGLEGSQLLVLEDSQLLVLEDSQLLVLEGSQLLVLEGSQLLVEVDILMMAGQGILDLVVDILLVLP